MESELNWGADRFEAFFSGQIMNRYPDRGGVSINTREWRRGELIVSTTDGSPSGMQGTTTALRLVDEPLDATFDIDALDGLSISVGTAYQDSAPRDPAVRIDTAGTEFTGDLYYGSNSMAAAVTSTVPRIVLHDAGPNILVSNIDGPQYTAQLRGDTNLNNDKWFLKTLSNNTEVGGIRCSNSGTGTSFVTTSDYRLKSNVQPYSITSALNEINELQVRSFTWKNTGADDVGLIAHEAAEVVPEVVHGEKDGPGMQVIAYSSLVPRLIASVQALTAKVNVLEAYVAELRESNE